jgi:hypothetical protein
MNEHKYIGGVKKRHPEKSGIEPIIHMLMKGKVKLLSNSSLFGIIFQLSVDENDSEYMDVQNGKFVIPVTDYVFKVACIGETEGLSDGTINPYYDFDGVEKKVEAISSLLNEAKLQQKIWIDSIVGGRPPLCPSVVDVLFFSKEEETVSTNYSSYDNDSINQLVGTTQHNYDEYPGKPFLSLFFKNLTGQEKQSMKRIVNVFSSVFNKNTHLELGIIVMPMISNSSTLINYCFDTPNREFIPAVKAAFVAKVIRLFIESGVVHLDLHGYNVLVYRNRDGLLDVVIIDFGKICYIESGIPDMYLTKAEKRDAMRKQNLFLNKLATMSLSSPSDDKLDYIDEVVTEINDILSMGSMHYISYYTDDILLMAFNILRNTIVPGSDLPLEELVQFCTEGCIYPIDKPLSSHYILNSNIPVGKEKNKNIKSLRKTLKKIKEDVDEDYSEPVEDASEPTYTYNDEDVEVEEIQKAIQLPRENVQSINERIGKRAPSKLVSRANPTGGRRRTKRHRKFGKRQTKRRQR